MKKNFKFYIIIWVILLAVYNLTVFLVKPIIPGYIINYDARFWISWGVIIATFIGQLFCAKVAFNSKNNEKLFLNIPLVMQSYTALIIVTVIGSVLMIIPDCPAWITAIVCVAMFGFSAISVIKAKFAADVISEIDEKIKVQTQFIKLLTADAEHLMSVCKTAGLKTEAKKVYEAIRYSDPMSSDALENVEKLIQNEFASFEQAVKAEDSELAKSVAETLIELIDDRNKKCKALK